MEYFKDACVCIIMSGVILFFSSTLDSNFFTYFMDSLMQVICTIFAINIASTALIAELIHKVSEKTGHTFEKSKNTLMRELKIQGFLILAMVFFMIIYYADYEKINETSKLFQYKYNIKLGSKLGLLSIFLYFIWLTYDLGKSLFAILKANYSNNNTDAGTEEKK